jgi:hypothetical protein
MAMGARGQAFWLDAPRGYLTPSPHQAGGHRSAAALPATSEAGTPGWSMPDHNAAEAEVQRARKEAAAQAVELQRLRASHTELQSQLEASRHFAMLGNR